MKETLRPEYTKNLKRIEKQKGKKYKSIKELRKDIKNDRV